MEHLLELVKTASESRLSITFIAMESSNDYNWSSSSEDKIQASGREKKILIITEPGSLWLKLWLVWFSSYFHYAAQYSFSYKSERMQEKMALLKTIYTDLENMHFKMETNSAVTDNRGAQRQIIN